MNRIKGWKYTLILGIFTLLFSMGFIQGINKNAEGLLSTFGFDKISVEAKENPIKSRTYGFTKKEVWHLKRKLKENLTLFVFPFEENIKNSSNTMFAKILAVSASYPSFADVHMVQGSFLTEKQEENQDRVLVIEEEAALRIFKSTDILGMDVELMDKSFTVIGVNKRKRTFLSNLLKRKEPDVYIPLQTAFVLDENIEIPYLQISILEDEKGIQSEKAVGKILEDMGKGPSNYKIVDYRGFQKRAYPINAITTLIFAMLMIYYLIRSQIKTIKEIFSTLADGCKSHYFLEAVQSNKRTLGFLMIHFLFLICCTYIVLKRVRFDFYLSAIKDQYDLYDISIFINNLFEVVAAKTLFQCISYFSEFLITFISILGVTLGGLLLYLSFYFLQHTRQQIDKVLFFFSVSYLAALLFASIVMKVIQLPAMIDIKSTILIYSFLFFITYRKLCAFNKKL
ncbi:ABC transporter permease [Geosporobacter ferrireducens]|uniref:ABC transporter permease n=1 Tax=Geosporobacter ferrireducens TaxID=1424294 RepID=UPI00139AF6A4|nr:ABC transporter permease [Geosporobacter ferrireducens]MTI55442.1 ABC transporter permease [Geosporobacter ferrireducens]